MKPVVTRRSLEEYLAHEKNTVTSGQTKINNYFEQIDRLIFRLGKGMVINDQQKA